MLNYRLIVSKSATLPHHSFGKVETVDDLYDPKIFGSNRDGACACGKYAGGTADFDSLEGTLLYHLPQAIASGDDSVAVLLRCAGYALRLEGEV